MTFWFFIALLVVTSVVVYYKYKMWLWSLIVVILFGVGFLHRGESINCFMYWLLAIISLSIILIGNIAFIRKLILMPVYLTAKNFLPKISETEALALNAGDSWWERDLFQGNPDYNKLHELHPYSLSQEEQRFINNETEELCKMINDWQITHYEYDMPVSVWEYIKQKGFFGLVIKKQYGGKEFSAAAHSEIILKLATRSSSVAVTVMVPNSLGPGELLHHYGTPKQKEYYLPRLACGEEIPCFALTGPTAGSDATSIPDLGIVAMGKYRGDDCLGIKLSNVNKRYITLAPVATLVGLAFQLKDPDNLLGGIGRAGITCALLPHTHEGLEIGARALPLNQVFMNGTIRIKESFIPIDWVIGGQAMCGEGWRMLVECLSVGRAISLPTCGTANALLSTITTSAYSLVREQFKVAIANFEGIVEGLAQMGGISYMMNATRRFTVAAVDAGIRPSVASAITKYHLTENGRKVVNWAMDIHAGRGIMMGQYNYLGRMYQAVPIAITVEGANIITRNLMIFGQGTMLCHPFIRSIYESLQNPDGYIEFDRAFIGHVAYFLHNKVCAIFNGLSAGYFARGYHSSKFNHYYKALSRLSSTYAFIADLSVIILNGNLKTRERLSARLGDAMSYLYMASASLKYFKERGEPKSDELFVRWVMEYTLFNAQEAILNTLANFPIRSIAATYKFLLFPYGRPHQVPSDKLEQALVDELLRDGEVRQELKRHISLPMTMEDPVGRMEVTFQAVRLSMPIKAKIHAAVKSGKLPKAGIIENMTLAYELDIISANELEHLRSAYAYTDLVIQVDEFKPDELGNSLRLKFVQ